MRFHPVRKPGAEWIDAAAESKCYAIRAYIRIDPVEIIQQIRNPIELFMIPEQIKVLFWSHRLFLLGNRLFAAEIVSPS